MKKVNVTDEPTVVSMENIIDLIRSARNAKVKNLLEGNEVSTYFRLTFDRDLTRIKRHFIERELTELLISPVDLVHYARLITELKMSNSLTLPESHEAFIAHEIGNILSKYKF